MRAAVFMLNNHCVREVHGFLSHGVPIFPFDQNARQERHITYHVDIFPPKCTAE
jgi:hypothetical protein